jgi:LmbE family N-acetylglucosaminyl deacetylase
MAIGAHPDDNECWAYHGILECFGSRDKHFMGVVVTNGSGSARGGPYADYTDEEMRQVRRLELRKASTVGEYCAMVMLDYPSSEVKDSANTHVVGDIKKIISAARPQVIYTNNLADKHDTHVSVALRVVRAIRELPSEVRPKRLYGGEAWRDLDWMNDDDKVVFNVGEREHLFSALFGVFDSQICGAKRYDLGLKGRMQAHASMFASHDIDTSSMLQFAMDMTPLIVDDALDPGKYVVGLTSRFVEDVSNRISKFA